MSIGRVALSVTGEESLVRMVSALILHLTVIYNCSLILSSEGGEGRRRGRHRQRHRHRRYRAADEPGDGVLIGDDAFVIFVELATAEAVAEVGVLELFVVGVLEVRVACCWKWKWERV